jgi:hypothetical protein
MSSPLGSFRLVKPAPAIIAAVVALAVLVATILGALDGMPGPVKGTIQFFGTVGGIVLGYLLQARDAEIRGQSRAGAAREQLVALAESVGLVLNFIAERRSQLDENSTVLGMKRDADASLAGIDSHLRGILRQAHAATKNWDFEGTAVEAQPSVNPNNDSQPGNNGAGVPSSNTTQEAGNL